MQDDITYCEYMFWRVDMRPFPLHQYVGSFTIGDERGEERDILNG